MKYLIYIYTILALRIEIATASPAQTILLSVGESYSLSTSLNDQIWLEKRKILKVKDFGSTLMITAIKAGNSQLRVGTKSFQVFITDDTSNKSSERFFHLLNLISDLKQRSHQDDLIVYGRMRSASDWISLAQLGFTHWKLEASIDDDEIRKVESHLNKELSDVSYPTVKIEGLPHPGVRIAKGESKIETEGIQILKKYGLHLIEDEKTIAVDPLIRVKMTVAEVRKSSLTTYGIKWPNQFSAKVLGNGSISNQQFSPDLFISALENTGEGRVLASPTILCRSGKEAEFLAGGEIPIKLVSEKNAEVIWKKYGIRMNIKPKSDPRGRLRIELETEVSSIDPGQKIDGIPAIFTNRVMSHFDLLKSQTIFLSGLIKKIDGKAMQGLPGLSQLPILGALFSSRDFQHDQTELVVLVTPEIVRE